LKVEFVDPPSGCAVGERVYIEGQLGQPLSSSQVQKKKIWEKVLFNLKTDSVGFFYIFDFIIFFL
jgi:hypothetical protein